MSGAARTIGQIGAVALGGVVGGPLGGAVANLAYNVLFPPPKAGNATTIGDLLNTGASYGTGIKRIYGLMPIQGDVIDCGIDPSTGLQAGIQIIMEKTQNSLGTGSGGGTPTYPNYFLTCAFLLCQGPAYIEQILRSDSGNSGTVVFDRYNSGDSGQPAGGPDLSPVEWRAYVVNQFNGSQTYRQGGGQMTPLTPHYAADGSLMAETSQTVRFYAGTEYQQVDSALAAIHGASAVPYRGYAYIMFNQYGPLNGPTTFTFYMRSMLDNKREMIRQALIAGGFPEQRIMLNSIQTTTPMAGAASAVVEAPRVLPEKIAATEFHDLAVIGGSLCDVSRLNPTTWNLATGDVGARVIENGNGEAVTRSKSNIPSGRERPTRLILRFLDINNQYLPTDAVAVRDNTPYELTVTVEWPVAGNINDMLRLVDTLLDEIWAAQPTDKIAVLPGRGQITLGNRVVYDPGDGTGLRSIRITKRNFNPKGPLEFEGSLYDPGVYGIQRLVSSTPIPRATAVQYAVPAAVLLDLPPLRADMQTAPGLIVGAGGMPWGSAVISSDPLAGIGIISLTSQAVVGTLVDAFSYTSSQAGLLNSGLTIRVRLIQGVLGTVTEAQLRAGANMLAIQCATGAGLLTGIIASYLTATPVSGMANTYDLSTLWPGRYGTDAVLSAPAGAPIMLLADSTGANYGMTEAPYPLSLTGSALTYTVESATDPTKISGTLTAGFSGNNLRPLPVTCITKASDGSGGYVLSFFPRTRDFASAAAWWSTGHPPNELDPRQFTVALYNGVTLVNLQSITWPTTSAYPVQVEYTEANLTTWLGAVPGTLTGSIWHVGNYLQGQERDFTV